MLLSNFIEFIVDKHVTKFAKTRYKSKVALLFVFVGVISVKLGKLFLRLFYEIKRAVVRKPFIAEVDITDSCNLRCCHCYHFKDKAMSNKKTEREEPSLEEWRKRFYELKRKGIRMIMLMGGEPMLRPDVVELADRMFPFVETITNGTIRIPEDYDHRVFVSIDGMERTNDTIRGEGVFEKVIKNFAGDRRVVFNMTLAEENYKELGKVVELSEKVGAAGVVCNIYTSLSKNDPQAVKGDVRKKIIEELRRVKKLKPGTFLITESAIKWFEKGDHREKCYWRDEVLHFDVNWMARHCFASADCSNCGCFAGAMGHPFNSLKHIFGLAGILVGRVFEKIKMKRFNSRKYD